MTSSENPFAPPRAVVVDLPVEADEFTLAPANPWKRLGAYVVDFLILDVLLVAVLALGRGRIGVASGSISWQSTFSTALVMALTLLVNGYGLWRSGQSLGKHLLRIRIVRPNGGRATLWRLVGLRMLPWTLLGNWMNPWVLAALMLADTAGIFFRSRRCLHDRLADTIVINANGLAIVPRTATT